MDNHHTHCESKATGNCHQEHGMGCSCCDGEEIEQMIWPSVFGVIIYFITLFTGLIPETYHILAYGIAYFLLGNGILKAAISNIVHGRMFDETLLMVIATLGAFANGEYAEAVGVMLFNRIGETLEERATNRSRGQIIQAVDLRPQTVRRITAGTLTEIPAAEAVPGDYINVRVGDRIPLDGIVMEGQSLVDTSAITGEPVPVLYQQGDTVFSGGVNTTGVLIIRVTKELSESMVSKILRSVEDAAEHKPHMDRFITRFARIYTPIVVAIAAATAIIPTMITGQWYHWIYIALTFLVISCPCALVLSVPLSFFAGIGAASKSGILFKGGAAIEALSKVKVVVLDKTGTVTKGNFVVQAIHPATDIDEAMLLQLCASAEKNSSHPIAQSLVHEAEQRRIHALAPSQVEEIAGKGIQAMIGGQQLLCGNRELLEDRQVAIPALAVNEYGTELFAALDGQFLGTIIISDTIKNDAIPAISRLHQMGVKTAMLTGDSEKAATYIANKTAIDEVKAKLLPQNKVDAMWELRKKYGSVLFVGDGINDAPVLAGADVGAAMGSGADAAVEAADVVFLNSQVTAIPQAFSLVKKTIGVAWQNVIFALTVKGLVMVLGFAGYASMWAAVFADTGVAMLCVLNSIRILYGHRN